LMLKYRFSYINSDTIILAVASKILFERGFEKLSTKKKNAGVFSREGITFQAKMFLYTAGRAGFLRNVLHNLPVITPNVLFPRECDNLVLISDVLPYYAHKTTNVIVLKDNPYLQWREVARKPPMKRVVGLLFGDDWNRWVEQEILDREILEKLKDLGCTLCLGRPHPQELTRPERVRYYNDLVEDYPFLKLELGETKKFLTDISLLIVYTKSTMVQEAMLCSRPIIEYRAERDFSPNQDVLTLSNNLGASISDSNSLEDEMHNCYSRSNKRLELIWKGFLKNLEISITSKLNINNIFDQQLINPIIPINDNSD
jgi:hypothetical protein